MQEYEPVGQARAWKGYEQGGTLDKLLTITYSNLDALSSYTLSSTSYTVQDRARNNQQPHCLHNVRKRTIRLVSAEKQSQPAWLMTCRVSRAYLHLQVINVTQQNPPCTSRSLTDPIDHLETRNRTRSWGKTLCAWEGNLAPGNQPLGAKLSRLRGMDAKEVSTDVITHLLQPCEGANFSCSRLVFSVIPLLLCLGVLFTALFPAETRTLPRREEQDRRESVS